MNLIKNASSFVDSAPFIEPQSHKAHIELENCIGKHIITLEKDTTNFKRAMEKYPIGIHEKVSTNVTHHEKLFNNCIPN